MRHVSFETTLTLKSLIGNFEVEKSYSELKNVELQKIFLEFSLKISLKRSLKLFFTNFLICFVNQPITLNLKYSETSL